MEIQWIYQSSPGCLLAQAMLAKILPSCEKIKSIFLSFIPSQMVDEDKEDLCVSKSRALVRYGPFEELTLHMTSGVPLCRQGNYQTYLWSILAKTWNDDKSQISLIVILKDLHFHHSGKISYEQASQVMDGKTQMFCFPLFRAEKAVCDTIYVPRNYRLDLDMSTSELSDATEDAVVNSIEPLWDEKSLNYSPDDLHHDLALANGLATYTTFSPEGRRSSFEAEEATPSDESADEVEDSDDVNQPLSFSNHSEVLQEHAIAPTNDASSQTVTCDLTPAPRSFESKPIILKPESQKRASHNLSMTINKNDHNAPDQSETGSATAEIPSPSLTLERPSFDSLLVQEQIRVARHSQRYYAWLLNRDPGDSDLLIIRVTERGNILRPVMVFDSARWSKPKFRKILDDEEPRLPEYLVRKFTFDKRGRHYFSRSSYLDSGIQFCAIVPLKPQEYHLQRRSIKGKDRLFDPLESLLGISELLSNASNEAKKWCKCRSECWKLGGSMILCDNMKCQIGWYHKRCVGVGEVSASDSDSESNLDCDYEWLCRRCTKIPRKNLDFAEDMDMPYGKLAEASSDRVQQAKALDRVWRRHSWPPRREIVDTFKMIRQNMHFDSSSGLSKRQYKNLKNDFSRHWVTRKDSEPPDMIPARSNGRQLTYC